MISRRLAQFGRLGAGELSARGLVVLEFFAIALAIALGFWVNEWREARARARVAETALRAIARELGYNQIQAEAIWTYYRAILREIEALPATGPGEPPAPTVYGYQLPGWQGAMPPLLRSSSFATMASTGALGNLSFDRADQLARIYNFQSVIERLDSALLAQVANDPGFTRASTIRHSFGLYVEMLPSLLAIYEAWAEPILAEHGFAPEVADPELRAEVERRLGRLR
jgi:hypothetical protein